jgi:hypothetical protein
MFAILVSMIEASPKAASTGIVPGGLFARLPDA